MGLNPFNFFKPKKQDEIDITLPAGGVQELATPEDRVIYAGEHFTAASSNVEEFWYSYDDKELFITFKNGATYQYIGVPPDVVRDFMKTGSPGRFQWSIIRSYPYNKLSDFTIPKSDQHPTVVRALPIPPKFRAG